MYSKVIRSWIKMLSPGELFLAKEAYEKYFSDMSEATFYQLLARMHNEHIINKVSKGLYYRPFLDDETRLPDSFEVIKFLTDDQKSGMIVGNKLLYDLGIVDINPLEIEVITNKIEIKSRRNFNDVILKTVNLDFRNDKIKKTIGMLEIIENIDNYTSYNSELLYRYIVEFACSFDQQLFLNVISAYNCKKRNISCVNKILDYFGVFNTLTKLLNDSSIYRFSDKIIETIEKHLKETKC